MIAVVASLSILGYAMTAGGIALLVIVTPRAIRRIGERADQIEAEVGRIARLRYAALLEGDSQGDVEREISELRRTRYDDARIPYSQGLSWGGPEHQPMMLTLWHVWHANTWNTIIAVTGGAVSTAASVWSLYVH